jgi:predicted translin family RNA/ssDNA-binding protein
MIRRDILRIGIRRIMKQWSRPSWHAKQRYEYRTDLGEALDKLKKANSKIKEYRRFARGLRDFIRSGDHDSSP